MITEATAEDIIIINELGKNMYPNFESIFKLEEYILNDNYVILVNKDVSISGFLIIYKNIDYYELEVIFVSKDYRKKGIATRLLDYFISKYTHTNDSILLEVSCENIKAINLYKKNGFDIITIRKKYYKNTDAYVMKKVIN